MAKNICITNWDFIIGGFGILLILQFVTVVSRIQGRNAEWTDPEIYLSAIAAICGVIFVIIVLIKGLIKLIGWCKRRRRKKILFNIRKPKEYKTNTSDKTQSIAILLAMNLETNVRFLSLVFRGDGQAPSIEKLYDYRRKDKQPPNDVDVHEQENGKWYWKYDQPWRREKNAKITIGIDIIAKFPFKGQLNIALTSSDGGRLHILPVEIIA